MTITKKAASGRPSSSGLAVRLSVLARVHLGVQPTPSTIGRHLRAVGVLACGHITQNRGTAAAVGDATGASNDYTDTRETAIRDDMATGDAATLDAANNYTDQQIANVGEIATGAANDYTDQQVADVRTDMVAGDAATLVAANTYADAGDAATLTSANTYTDNKVAAITLDFSNFRTEVNDRFESQDQRINQVGAMGAAMANMTASAAGVRTRNRVAVGMGNYRGENSIAFGYQRAMSNRAVFAIGGAFNSDDSTIGAGAAFGW